MGKFGMLLTRSKKELQNPELTQIILIAIFIQVYGKN